MGPFPVIAEIYVLCAGFGTLFVLFTAMMGAHGHSGGQNCTGHSVAGGHGLAGGRGIASGHGGPAAHGAAGARGAVGGHSAPAAQGPAHAGSSGPARGGGLGFHAHPVGGHSSVAHPAGHTGAPHASGHPGAAKAPTGPGTHGAGARVGHTNTGAARGQAANTSSHTGSHTSSHASGNAAELSNNPLLPANKAQTAVINKQASDDRLAMLILTFCNPALICMFVALFGSFGLILWRTLPVPIAWTIPIAIVSALLGTKLVMNVLSWLMGKLVSSKTYTMETVIGCEAEVTVGVGSGHVGEIMYTVGSRRYTASARGAKPEWEFKRGETVVIVDMLDDVAIISSLLDEGTAFDAELAQQPPILLPAQPEQSP